MGTISEEWSNIFKHRWPMMSNGAVFTWQQSRVDEDQVKEIDVEKA